MLPVTSHNLRKRREFDLRPLLSDSYDINIHVFTGARGSESTIQVHTGREEQPTPSRIEVVGVRSPDEAG